MRFEALLKEFQVGIFAAPVFRIFAELENTTCCGTTA